MPRAARDACACAAPDGRVARRPRDPMSAPTSLPAWPHGARFVAAAQALAQATYDGLDRTLNPQVGVLRLEATGGVAGLRAAAFEPAALALPSALLPQVERARAAQPADATPSLSGARARVLEAWRHGLQQVLAAHEPAGEWSWFAGEGRSVEGGALLPIVRVARAAWSAYDSLQDGDLDRRERRPTSLLDAVTHDLLRRFSAAVLDSAERGSEPLLDHDPEEVLASAGRRLADRPALGAGQDLDLRGLFQTCTTLAGMPHEGRGTRGRIIVARPSHPGLQRRMVLAAPVRLHDVPVVRKLLVTCRQGVSLLSDGSHVHALGTLDITRSLAGESLFVITFEDHSTWEMARGLRRLMRVTYGRPRLVRDAFSEQRFLAWMTRAFGLVDEEDLQVLLRLARAASEQPKGTILLISRDARNEAERLAFQGMPVTPAPLDAETLRAVSSMDGAVLVGLDATCFAVGVILDGVSHRIGDPARGARYNSALRYVHSTEQRCLAVVVSEDGRVDLISR